MLALHLPHILYLEWMNGYRNINLTCFVAIQLGIMNEQLQLLVAHCRNFEFAWNDNSLSWIWIWIWIDNQQNLLVEYRHWGNHTQSECAVGTCISMQVIPSSCYEQHLTSHHPSYYASLLYKQFMLHREFYTNHRAKRLIYPMLHNGVKVCIIPFPPYTLYVNGI